MQIITKDELNSTLGAGSFWFPKKAPGSLTYLHGVADFDALRADTAVPSPFNLHVRPGGLAVSIMHGFTPYHLAVPFGQLLSVSLETPDEIVLKRQRSVIGRAVLSGVALGQVGAIIGALSGLGDTHRVIKPDSLLTLEVATASQPAYLVAGIGTGIFSAELRKWLLKNLPGYYKAEG